MTYGVESGGRALLIAGMALMITNELITIAIYTSSFGTERLPIQLGRLLVTAGLIFFLFRGYRAVRWILVILLMLGLAVLSSAAIASYKSGVTLGSTLLTLMSLAYLFAARILIWSPRAKAYLEERRAERLGLQVEPDAT
jgi:hypothetical protein